MTILKDQLAIRPDEPAVEYAERVDSVLERHYQETGERFKPTDDLPGERPGECLERFKKLDEAFNIKQAERELRAAERERTQGKPSTTSSSANKDTSAAAEAAEKSRRSYRLKSQERDIQRAGAAFEDAEKKLYRMSGKPVYGGDEHEERIGKLREEFAQRVEKIISEAETDAEGYEKEARAYSYTDPAKDLTSSERARLETSRVFIKEDAEDMSVPALSERISAVSAGSDKVAKVLHARYSRRRLEALNNESNRLAREGQPAGPEAAREIRPLSEAVAALEEEIKDPGVEKRRQAAQEAANASRQLAGDARMRKSEVDGTAELARQRQAEMTRAAF